MNLRIFTIFCAVLAFCSNIYPAASENTALLPAAQSAIDPDKTARSIWLVTESKDLPYPFGLPKAIREDQTLKSIADAYDYDYLHRANKKPAVALLRLQSKFLAEGNDLYAHITAKLLDRIETKRK